MQRAISIARLLVIRPKLPRRIGKDDGILLVLWKRRVPIADAGNLGKNFGVAGLSPDTANPFGGFKDFTLAAGNDLALLALASVAMSAAAETDTVPRSTAC